MRRWSTAAISICGLALAQTVSAADLPIKAPKMESGAGLSWAGWYVGLNAGGAWENTIDNSVVPGACSFTAPQCAAYFAEFNAALPTTFDTHPTGFIGGGQIGYNWQIAPQWLSGIEADFQGADIKGSANTSGSATVFPLRAMSLTGTGSQKIDWLGTVRARLGWLPVGDVLLYVTGGLAYGHVETAVSFSQQNPEVAGSTALSRSDTRSGWTVGAGLEWMFARHWSMKGEYLYYDLGTVSMSQTLTTSGLPGSANTSIQSEARYHGSIARLGVNYKF